MRVRKKAKVHVSSRFVRSGQVGPAPEIFAGFENPGLVVRASFRPILAANLSHQGLTRSSRLAARMGHPASQVIQEQKLGHPADSDHCSGRTRLLIGFTPER
jgi:hypothetical protein